MDKSFVDSPVHVRFPKLIELVAYCDADLVTTELVEAVARITENFIGEPIDRVAPKLFPQALRGGIAHEAELAWKAGRPLGLCTKLSSPNYVSINVERTPRRSASGRHFYGKIQILLSETAPKAPQIARLLAEIVQISQAIFARADSPSFWESREGQQLPLLRTFVFSDDWLITERFGWHTYLSAPLSAANGPGIRACGCATSPIGSLGQLVSASIDPLDFTNPDHAKAYTCIALSIAE